MLLSFVFQELEESRIRTTTQIEEVDSRVEQEYEARLQDALREIRAQHDSDLQSVKVELETLYECKVRFFPSIQLSITMNHNLIWLFLECVYLFIDKAFDISLFTNILLFFCFFLM